MILGITAATREGHTQVAGLTWHQERAMTDHDRPLGAGHVAAVKDVKGDVGSPIFTPTDQLSELVSAITFHH